MINCPKCASACEGPNSWEMLRALGGSFVSAFNPIGAVKMMYEAVREMNLSEDAKANSVYFFDVKKCPKCNRFYAPCQCGGVVGLGGSIPHPGKIFNCGRCGKDLYIIGKQEES